MVPCVCVCMSKLSSTALCPYSELTTLVVVAAFGVCATCRHDTVMTHADNAHDDRNIQQLQLTHRCCFLAVGFRHSGVAVRILLFCREGGTSMFWAVTLPLPVPTVPHAVVDDPRGSSTIREALEKVSRGLWEHL